MTRVLHLLDRCACWEQRVALAQLLERLPASTHVQALSAVDPAAIRGVDGLARPIRMLHGGRTIAALGARSVLQKVQRERIDLVHAWGIRAAVASGAALSAPRNPGVPFVVELLDPRVTIRQIKILRVLARGKRMAIVTSGQRLIRRLVEGGVPPESCVLIRPGVDFGLINQCKRGPLRGELGLAPGNHIVLIPDPPTPGGGRWEEFWCTILLSYFDANVRAVVPGHSKELPRIRRQAGFIPGKPVLITPGDRYPFEQLVAIADTLLLSANDDVSTTVVSWAMASETLVVAPAVHSVAELIAHKVNGVLFSPKGPRRPALSMSALFTDTSGFRKLKDVARAQAYEVFSIRRYVRQHQRVYDNLLDGRPLSEGIEDPAAF